MRYKPGIGDLGIHISLELVKKRVQDAVNVVETGEHGEHYKQLITDVGGVLTFLQKI